MARTQHSIERSRTSTAWVALAFGLVVLLVAAVFMAQNGDDVAIEFLVWDWSLATGVALLFAFVLGGLTVVLLGAARIMSLRRTAKKHRREDEAEIEVAEPGERQPVVGTEATEESESARS